MIDVGKPAPDFTAQKNSGGTFTLSDMKGQVVVLYFYPKDDIPGCTKQAKEFSEHLAAFEKAGAIVVGISKDSVKKHGKFITKHDLKVVLVADEDLVVNEKYGVWVEKKLYGRKYMGTERTTVLIDKAGVIQRLWSKVKLPGHVEEVLAAVQAL